MWKGIAEFQQHDKMERKHLGIDFTEGYHELLSEI